MSEARQFKSRRDVHWQRKVFHCLMGTVIALLLAYAVDRKTAVIWTLTLGLGLGLFDLLRLSFKPLNQLIQKIFGPLMRESELTEPSAQLFYILGVLFSVLFLPKTLAIQAILTLAWMDPIAGLVGLKFGRHSWNAFLGSLFSDSRHLPIDLGAKTIEGSAAGFLVAVLAGVFAWTGPWAAVEQSGGPIIWPQPSTILIFSASGAVIAMVAEAWPSQWDDNANIPFWTGLGLWALAVLLGVPIVFH